MKLKLFAFEIKIHKINVQMAQRVNIVASVSYRSYNISYYNRNIITLDLPLWNVPWLHKPTHTKKKQIIYPKKTLKIISFGLFHFSVFICNPVAFSVKPGFAAYFFSFCDWRCYDVCINLFILCSSDIIM